MSKLDQIVFECPNYKYDLKIINTQRTKKYIEFNKHNIQIIIQEKNNNLFWGGSIYLNNSFIVCEIIRMARNYKHTQKTETIIFPNKVFESQKINIIFKVNKSTIIIPCDQINNEYKNSNNAQRIYNIIEQMNENINKQNMDIKNKIVKIGIIYLISFILFTVLFILKI